MEGKNNGGSRGGNGDEGWQYTKKKGKSLCTKKDGNRKAMSCML